ncbi:hypothetical protein JCM12296A_59980 [Desulfosarcina cetonica]|uniref:hypothetical protein n=1 Tax=Desulfosarcina cetonica TaxID=90730 RepID=UPI0006D13E4B|nr:hypothetical protein [Desulfosarcina cetonica]
MAKKANNLVDSFMSGFLKDAKEAVDRVTEKSPTDKKQNLSPIKQHHISIISPSEQHQEYSSNVADNYQVSNRNIADNQQEKLSSKHQDGISVLKEQKSSKNISPSPSLSTSQTKVWLWFKEKGKKGLFNKPEIANGLDMPYITVRLAIQKLEKIGVINLKYDRCQKNYEYELVELRNLKLSKNISITSASEQQHISITSPSPNSSSNLNKTTTYQDLEKILKTNPELAYWQSKGFTSKQMASWISRFSLTTEDLVQSLCYCRFNLVENGIEESKNIRDPLDWIFKILERSGAHPRPNNYKSHHDKLIDREIARAEEIHRQAEALKKARMKKAEVENELKFEQMMQEGPEGDQYSVCFEKLPAFLKKPQKEGSIAFNEAMKKNFLELQEDL